MSLPHRIMVAGRATTIREAAREDVPLLVEHYRSLPGEDLRRRFLSTFRPDERFVSAWIDRSEQGGAVLVAVEQTDDGERIVADAGYVPSGKDTAELAMTVAADRRGWLGPFLLDVLVEHARDAGIADLTAEILPNNAGMLALLRSRGCAQRPGEDPSVLEFLIGTSGTTPSWPADSPRPRVLVEGSAAAWPGSRMAARTGLSVLACAGPGHGRSHPCPMLTGRSCPLVEEADVVVLTMPAGSPCAEQLLAAHTERDGDQPLLVSTNGERGPDPDRYVRWTPLDPLASVSESLRQLRAAIDEIAPPASDAGRRDHAGVSGGPAAVPARAAR